MSAKDSQFEQFGRTSDDGNADVPDITSNQGRSPMVDLHGRLVVRLANDAGFVNPESVFQLPAPPTQFAVGADLPFSFSRDGNTFVASNVPSRLYTVNVAAELTSEWVQFFNKADAPVLNDIPFLVVRATLNTSISLNFGDYGIGFSVGLSMGVSSTFGTFTASVTPANYIISGTHFNA